MFVSKGPYFKLSVIEMLFVCTADFQTSRLSKFCTFCRFFAVTATVTTISILDTEKQNFAGHLGCPQTEKI